MLRQPQKPALADVLWTKLTPEARTQPKGDVQYVLDGDALLHRVPCMAKRFSDLQSSVQLVLHLRAKEIRKSNSGV